MKQWLRFSLLSLVMLLGQGAIASPFNSIAEIYIEPRWIRVELEIGLDDLDGFRDMVPDTIYERLTGQKKSLSNRLQQFFLQDFVLKADDEALLGKLSSVEVRVRKTRDSISAKETGKAIKERVLSAILIYPFTKKPSVLTIDPPDISTAQTGFVIYHNGIPINDLSDLSQAELVFLNWNDPACSAFQSARLARHFNQPTTAILVIEPDQVQKQIIVRLADIQAAWFDLGLHTDSLITSKNSRHIKRQVMRFLEGRNPIMVNGVSVQSSVTDVDFVLPHSAEHVGVEGEYRVPFNQALMAIRTVYPISSPISSASMQWQLFDKKSPRIVGRVIHDTQSQAAIVRQESSILTWKKSQSKKNGASIHCHRLLPIKSRLPIHTQSKNRAEVVHVHN